MSMTFATNVVVDSDHNLNLQGMPVYHGTCSSAAGEVKVVTCNGFVLATGAVIFVTFDNTNSLAVASLTMNVNGTGAKPIKKMNNGALGNLRAVGELVKNVPYHFGYDGTNWVLLTGVDYYASNSNTIPSAQCETAAATAAKVASLTYYTLTANTWVHVNMRYANSYNGAITLNINSTGAKPIYINGAASSSSNKNLPAGTYIVYYNGTNFYFRTDGNITKTVSIGSASNWSAGSVPTLGTAIAADDITAWTTNTPTAVTKKTVVTSATFNTVVTGCTKKTVVTSASGATASYANGIATFTDGSFSTGDSVTVTTGASGSASTGDSVTVTAGTAASLSYTARSIPNVTSVGTAPSLTVTSTTVATGKGV